MTTPDSRQRPLATIDVSGIAECMTNGQGGYYDPADGGVIPILDGEIVTAEDSEPDPDDEGWIELELQESRMGYLDMAEFARAVTDPVLADRLERALEGKGAFKRFRNTLGFDQSQDETLYPIWARFVNSRTELRAIEWLSWNKLISEADGAAGRYACLDRMESAEDEIAAWRCQPREP